MRTCRIPGIQESRPPASAAGRTCSVLAALLILGLASVELRAPNAAAAAADEQATAAGGELFSGTVPFQNGGPACATCHSIGGLAFPNGGTMGPDLTQSYTLLGEPGMDATLETLFFPTMMPIFEGRLLTPDEQRALKAFLRQAQSSAPAANITWELLLLACAGCAALLLLAAVFWRWRLQGVRCSLVATTRAAEVRG